MSGKRLVGVITATRLLRWLSGRTERGQQGGLTPWQSSQ